MTAAAAILSAVHRNRLALYDPMRGMLPVHQSQSRLRFVRKPNQVGGTYSMGAEIWWAALDLHPYRPPIAPGAPIWVMLTDLKDEYVTVCEKLWSIAPRHRLADGCKYVQSKGFLYRGAKMLVLDNGRRVEFKSGTQDAMAVESGTVGAAFVNEPPTAAHLSGLLQRCSFHAAPVLMNFTPVGRPLEWLRALVEGEPERDIPPQVPGWEVFRPALTVEDCTTVRGQVIRSQESIDAQVSLMSPWERAQRQFGAWEGETADRRFEAWGQRLVFTDAELEDVEFEMVRAGIDHGEGDRKQCAYIVGLMHTEGLAPSVWVLSEYAAEAGSGPTEDTEGLLRALEDCGLTVYHLERIRGDINSAGKLGEGQRYNAILDRHIAAALGCQESPRRIQAPDKRRGSVNAGEVALSHAMREDRFRVHESCTHLIHALKHYRGPKDQDLKDPIDAVRYAVADVLLRARAKAQAIYRG